MAIKALQSYGRAHEGKKTPLDSARRTGLNDLVLLTGSRAEGSQKKTILFLKCLVLRRAGRTEVPSNIIPIINICRRRAPRTPSGERGAGRPANPARLCCTKPVNAASSSCSSSYLAPKGTELYNPAPLVTGRVYTKAVVPASS